MLSMIFVEISVLVQTNCLFKVVKVAICYENSCSFPEIYLWWNPCLVELRTIECTKTAPYMFKGLCICFKYIYKINRVLLGRKYLASTPDQLLKKVLGNLKEKSAAFTPLPSYALFYLFSLI